jgi:hypothetical protein
LTADPRLWNVGAMKNAVRLAAVVALVASVLPVTVDAGKAPRLHRLRMDGYVGAPPEGRRERADLQLRAGKKTVRFQVTSATVLSSDMLPTTIFSAVRPYRPNFVLRGPQAVIAKVADAADGARLRIVGGWRRGSRDFLLSSVETQSGETPPADTPPSTP